MLMTGTAIWRVSEPGWKKNNIEIEVLFETVNFFCKTYMKFLKGIFHSQNELIAT